MPNRSSPLAACVLLLSLAGCNPFAASPEEQAVKAVEKLGGKVRG
jgi:hypothetical protein